MDSIESEENDERDTLAGSLIPFTERPLVYISGPMVSQGNPYVNIKAAIDAGTYARGLGWSVIVPHLDCLSAMVSGINSADYYLDNDFNQLYRCDAVLVLPFEEITNCGTAQELDFAEFNGIPIYTQTTLPSANIFTKLMEQEEEALAHRTEIHADI